MVCSVRSTLVLEVLSYFLILLRQLTDSKKCTSHQFTGFKFPNRGARYNSFLHIILSGVSDICRG